MQQANRINHSELKKKSAQGGISTMAAQAITICIQIVSTIVLARILTPSDYGIVAMVLVVTGFAGVFRDLGLSTAAIQAKNLSREQQSNLFWLNIGAGTLLTALVASLSPAVSWFYSEPRLKMVTIVLSANFLIASIGAQHNAHLAREMRLSVSATANIFGAIIGLPVSIFLALQGASYWALVIASLSSSLTSTLILCKLSRLKISLPTKKGDVRKLLDFGASITAFDIVNYFSRNLDNALIGRFLGSAPLGLYSRAYSILMLPIGTLRGPINAVGLPALSRLQDDRAAFKKCFCRLTRILAFVSMPLTAFFLVSGKPLTNVIFGSNWQGVAPIYQVLAAVGFIQPVSSLGGMLMLSLGEGRKYFQVGLVGAILASGSFVIGLFWGAIGVASSYAIMTYLTLLPMMIWILKDSPVSLQDFFLSINSPAISSIASAILTYLLSLKYPSRPDALLITLQLLSFSFFYVAFTCTTKSGRENVSYCVNLIRMQFSK